MVNICKLKGIIAEKGFSQKSLAEMLGISTPTMYSKMKKGVFGSDEITAMARILQLNKDEVINIFFAN